MGCTDLPFPLNSENSVRSYLDTIYSCFRKGIEEEKLNQFGMEKIEDLSGLLKYAIEFMSPDPSNPYKLDQLVDPPPGFERLHILRFIDSLKKSKKFNNIYPEGLDIVAKLKSLSDSISKFYNLVTSGNSLDSKFKNELDDISKIINDVIAKY
ncbi:MAG: hypothetical protein PHE43_04390 [Candidatus Nanoarchaeia archaeon]|nr:hypothetical protein [Candidatus Nanoarchaeia archaeon]